MSWSVVSKEKEYTRESKKCNLCTREKLEILKNSLKDDSLNKRSEIMNKCRHRNKFLLSKINTNVHRRKNQLVQNTVSTRDEPETVRPLQPIASQDQNEILDPGDSGGIQERLQTVEVNHDNIYERGKTRSGRKYLSESNKI